MKKLLVVFLAVMLCAGISFAQNGDNTEEIILTTYYPAPYGTYNDLTANRIGIGTNNPNNLLEIVGGSSGAETALMQLRSNFDLHGTATTLRFSNSSNVGDQIGSAITSLRTNRNRTGNSDLIFKTSVAVGVSGPFLAERMRINHDGYVGIGVTDPKYRLDIKDFISGNPPAPAIRIVDGNQGDGKVLTSDTTGAATWQAPTGGLRVKSVTESTDIKITGDTDIWFDMPDMTITDTFNDETIFVLFEAPFGARDANDFGAYRIVINDVVKRAGVFRTNLVGVLKNQSMSWTGDVVSGTNTIKVQWQRHQDYSMHQKGATEGPRSLTVMRGLTSW
jgi:hypothetical protein